MVDQKKIYVFYEKISKNYAQCIFYEADTKYQENILNNVRMGQTKYDKEEPSGAIAKQLSGMESLFGSAVKK